jgi:hypothetical protein
MTWTDSTPRRGFLGRLFGAAAALSLPFAERPAEAQQADPDAWIKDVKGTHRALFDFPQMKLGMPLLNIANYINTYAQAYKAGPGAVGTVGTFYGMGAQSSIPFAFNDATWAKYGLGEYTGLKDAAGKPYTRNPFYQPTKNELHLVMKAIESPTIPMFADAVPGIGIAALTKAGTKFLLCANAFGGWCAELEARGKGKAPELMKELGANMLPGVTMVPAMVIAIEKAQAAGITYNRQ